MRFGTPQFLPTAALFRLLAAVYAALPFVYYAGDGHGSIAGVIYRLAGYGFSGRPAFLVGLPYYLPFILAFRQLTVNLHGAFFIFEMKRRSHVFRRLE